MGRLQALNIPHIFIVSVSSGFTRRFKCNMIPRGETISFFQASQGHLSSCWLLKKLVSLKINSRLSRALHADLSYGCVIRETFALVKCHENLCSDINSRANGFLIWEIFALVNCHKNLCIDINTRKSKTETFFWLAQLLCR